MDQLNEFMLKHGENIVDIMGDEIDRIEMNLSVRKAVYIKYSSLNESNNIFSVTLTFIWARDLDHMIPYMNTRWLTANNSKLTKTILSLHFNFNYRKSSRKYVTSIWN